jgi:hypothetical protein
MAKGQTDVRRAVNPLAPRAYRYGIVLILLFCTFLVMASGLEGDWVRLVSVALQGITLLAVLRASQVSRRIVRVAAVGVLCAWLPALGSVAFGSRTVASGVPALLSVLLVAAAPYVIARALWRRRIVDIHTVLGAICVYVLLGMLFAFVYEAIGTLGPTDFFVQTHTPDTADYLYFSFVTLTTVGYGDFTAATHFGRALAVLEALFGQIYLVTVVSLVVSRLVTRPGGPIQPSASDKDQ